MADDLTGESTELLQTLIRNECVNDGTAESGYETRNADVLRSLLEGSGADIETFEPTPGRASVVARIEGSDPAAPTICLMGHTDVVPVTVEGWSRDPFGGELVDGEVWGRGAIDMLNLTSTMAVAFRRLATSGRRPANTVVYFGVADEEAGGAHGAGWFAEHAYDAIRADYVITESGGIAMPTPDGRRVTVTVAEKGISWTRLRVRGTPGHGSMPFGADNALVKAAEVVRRLAAYRPASVVNDEWRSYVGALELPDDTKAALTDPARVFDACAELPDPRVAKYAQACTHTTFSPNVVHGGVKTNVIPDVVELDVDIRTLPGVTPEDVRGHLDDALGDLAPAVEVIPLQQALSTASPTRTPLWDALERLIQPTYPGAQLLPRMTVGGTDARFYREKGAIAYGFGLFSPDVTYAEFSSRFHGHDERIDVASLGLTAELFARLLEEPLPAM